MLRNQLIHKELHGFPGLQMPDCAGETQSSPWMHIRWKLLTDRGELTLFELPTEKQGLQTQREVYPKNVQERAKICLSIYFMGRVKSTAQAVWLSCTQFPFQAPYRVDGGVHLKADKPRPTPVPYRCATWPPRARVRICYLCGLDVPDRFKSWGRQPEGPASLLGTTRP